MVFFLSLDWKSFQIDLAYFHRWLKSNGGPQYSGLSADIRCDIVFAEKPTEEVLAHIHEYWAGLSEEGEGLKIDADAKQSRAIECAKQNLPYAVFDSLIPAERKIWMGTALSDEDKIELVAKYPNA